MKIFVLIFSLFLSLGAFAIDVTTVYTNEDSCKIEMSQTGSFYVITASKVVKGNTKSAQVIVRDDLIKGNITTYCMKEGSSVIEEGDTVTVSCNNERAEAKMVFKNQDLVSFDFMGFQYNFLTKKDDSFNCIDLSAEL